MQIDSLQISQHLSIIDSSNNQNNGSFDNNQELNYNSTNSIDKVEISDTQNSRSSIVANIVNSIDKISNIQTIQKYLDTQINAIDKISSISAQTGDIDTANELLGDTVQNFNLVSQDIEQILEDNTAQQSHTFFDGIAGSIPLKEDKLPTALEASKEQYQKLNKKLDSKTTSLLNDGKEYLSNLKNTNIDFEQESKNFTKDTLQNKNISNAIDTSYKISISYLL